jgi:hypothetical protein
MNGKAFLSLGGFVGGWPPYYMAIIVHEFRLEYFTPRVFFFVLCGTGLLEVKVICFQSYLCDFKKVHPCN